MLFFIVLVLIFGGLLAKWCKIVKSSNVPMMLGSLPVIGFTHKFLGNSEKLWRVFKDMSHFSLANGGIIRIVIAFQTYYVITDPEDLTTIGNSALKKNFGFEFARPWLGDGLLTGIVPVWKKHRKLLNPAFSLPLLQNFIPAFNKEARTTVDSFSEMVGKGPVDLTKHFLDNAMRTLCRTNLGLSEQETNLFHKYMHAADKFLALVVKRFQNAYLHFQLIYQLTGHTKKERDLIGEMNGMYDQVINASKSQPVIQSEAQKSKSFIDLLLELAANGIITEKEVREEVYTMLVAGTDTVTTMMTYVSVVIGSYPEVQKRVVEEMDRVFGESDRDVSKEDLQELVYLDAVIKEVLRLYPVGPLSVRTLEEGIQLKNHYLHPGDHVMMSFYGVNRHSCWGPDADQFRPDRWLDTKSIPKVNGSFGLGKRNCIGKTYALILLKIVMAHVLRRYHISADATNMTHKMDFLLTPVSGHLVSLTARNVNKKKTYFDCQ